VAQLLLYNIRLLLQKQDAMNCICSEKLYIKRLVVEISLDIKTNIMSPNEDFYVEGCLEIFKNNMLVFYM